MPRSSAEPWVFERPNDSDLANNPAFSGHVRLQEFERDRRISRDTQLNMEIETKVLVENPIQKSASASEHSESLGWRCRFLQ